MRTRRFHTEEEMPPTLGERLMMAVLAPVILNVSIVIVLCTFFKRSRALDDVLAYPAAHWSVWFYFFMLIFIPALIGFMMGVTRCVTIFGHLFLTSDEAEKSIPKTILAWASLVFGAFLLAKLLN